MEKYTRVQVEILLTADEKALLEHYVKENNRRYKKRGATRNWWTLEKLLQCLLSDITYQAVKHRSVRTVYGRVLCHGSECEKCSWAYGVYFGRREKSV